MSLLAGFDFGIDISYELLKFQIKTQLKANNLPVGSHIEMPDIPFSFKGATGKVYMILSSALFDI